MHLQRLAQTASLGFGLVFGALLACVPPAETPPAECPVGTVGCPCDAGQCDAGLECQGGICALPGPSTETGAETGTETSGTETGTETETGEELLPCEEPNYELSGQVEIEGVTISFDEVVVETYHKQDVDDFEDRCINRVTVTFSTSVGGCTMSIDAFGSRAGNNLVVRSMSLSAGNQCPDFPDLIEGDYEGSLVTDPLSPPEGNITDSVLELTSLEIPDENTSESCLLQETLRFRPSGSLHDDGTGNILSNLGGEIVVTGDLATVADANRPCPSECGNDMTEEYEQCDPSGASGSCTSLDYELGEWSCTDTCRYDISDCRSGQPDSGLFAACVFTEDCDQDLTCQTGFCTTVCTEDADCQAEVFGQPTCFIDMMDMQNNFCMLACDSNPQCPQGMACGPDDYCIVN